ncbi:MAG: prepilin-type N-terminal cleavage/methylation domain-containing protein [Desulfurobacteriaceae bacterium]
MKFGKGFTLLEILMAIALASVVVTVSYSIFNSLERSGKLVSESSEVQSTVIPIFYLFLKDFESIDRRYGKISIQRDENLNTDFVEIYTHSCYYFKGICKVKYWFYRNKDKNLSFLVRSESRINSTSNISVDVPISSKFERMNISFFPQNSLLKVVLEKKGEEKLPFIFRIRN